MTITTFDVTSLATALEADDPAAVAALYHPDAVVTVMGRDRGPARAETITGRDAIRARAEDVRSRNLTHTVDRAVADDRQGAVQITCAYPDGQRVVCASTFDLDQSLIVRETRFEVWD